MSSVEWNYLSGVMSRASSEALRTQSQALSRFTGQSLLFDRLSNGQAGRALVVSVAYTDADVPPIPAASYNALLMSHFLRSLGYDTTVLCGDEPTREEVLGALTDIRPDIVYVCAHAVSPQGRSPSPLSSPSAPQVAASDIRIMMADFDDTVPRGYLNLVDLLRTGTRGLDQPERLVLIDGAHDDSLTLERFPHVFSASPSPPRARTPTNGNAVALVSRCCSVTASFTCQLLQVAMAHADAQVPLTPRSWCTVNTTSKTFPVTVLPDTVSPKCLDVVVAPAERLAEAAHLSVSYDAWVSAMRPIEGDPSIMSTLHAVMSGCSCRVHQSPNSRLFVVELDPPITRAILNDIKEACVGYTPRLVAVEADRIYFDVPTKDANFFFHTISQVTSQFRGISTLREVVMTSSLADLVSITALARSHTAHPSTGLVIERVAFEDVGHLGSPKRSTSARMNNYVTPIRHVSPPAVAPKHSPAPASLAAVVAPPPLAAAVDATVVARLIARVDELEARLSKVERCESETKHEIDRVKSMCRDVSVSVASAHNAEPNIVSRSPPPREDGAGVLTRHDVDEMISEHFSQNSVTLATIHDVNNAYVRLKNEIEHLRMNESEDHSRPSPSPSVAPPPTTHASPLFHDHSDDRYKMLEAAIHQVRAAMRAVETDVGRVRARQSSLAAIVESPTAFLDDRTFATRLETVVRNVLALDTESSSKLAVHVQQLDAHVGGVDAAISDIRAMANALGRRHDDSIGLLERDLKEENREIRKSILDLTQRVVELDLSTMQKLKMLPPDRGEDIDRLEKEIKSQTSRMNENIITVQNELNHAVKDTTRVLTDRCESLSQQTKQLMHDEVVASDVNIRAALAEAADRQSRALEAYTKQADSRLQHVEQTLQNTVLSHVASIDQRCNDLEAMQIGFCDQIRDQLEHVHASHVEDGERLQRELDALVTANNKKSSIGEDSISQLNTALSRLVKESEGWEDRMSDTERTVRRVRTDVDEVKTKLTRVSQECAEFQGFLKLEKEQTDRLAEIEVRLSVAETAMATQHNRRRGSRAASELSMS